jgi:VIT1/CCC1 family predicted Fe2+/Mn2+ transporter
VAQHPTRVLDPIDRVSEVIFGVLMAMTFIGAMNVASAGRQEVRTAMIAALGCNIAWGLADAVMYVVAILVERTRERALPRLRTRDLKGAFGVFLLVAASTFPLVVPFFFFRELAAALIASRIVALVMLFSGGWLLARDCGGNKWLSGIALAATGAVLLAAIMALGG